MRANPTLWNGRSFLATELTQAPPGFKVFLPNQKNRLAPVDGVPFNFLPYQLQTVGSLPFRGNDG